MVTERLAILGLIIEWSAAMERTLRDAFCSLVGSKMAAVVAGGQSVAWLIEQCKALTDAHTELTDPARQAIKDALDLCKIANDRRNVLVHGLKMPSFDGSFTTHRSRRKTPIPSVQMWKSAELHEAAMLIADADSSLFAAMQNAVSRDLMGIGGVLMGEHYERIWELRMEQARQALARERRCSTGEISEEDAGHWVVERWYTEN